MLLDEDGNYASDDSSSTISSTMSTCDHMYYSEVDKERDVHDRARFSNHSFYLVSDADITKNLVGPRFLELSPLLSGPQALPKRDEDDGGYFKPQRAPQSGEDS